MVFSVLYLKTSHGSYMPSADTAWLYLRRGAAGSQNTAHHLPKWTPCAPLHHQEVPTHPAGQLCCNKFQTQPPLARRRDSFSQATVPVVVKSLSCVRLFAIPWTIACQGPLSFTVSQSLLKFMFIELGVLSNHLTLCSPSPPALQPYPASGSFPESAFHIRWPECWSFSFSLSPVPVRRQNGDRYTITGACALQLVHLS